MSLCPRLASSFILRNRKYLLLAFIHEICIMIDSTEVKIRESIAACRRAGNEIRFEDTIVSVTRQLMMPSPHTDQFFKMNREEYYSLYVVA
jgi:hypothetical protein